MSPKKSTARNSRKRSAKKQRISARHHGPLTHLSFKGFRGISQLDIDGLAPLTIFTGDNGAGKSTVLEAAFAVYGRKSPAWLPSLQARRGLGAFSSNEGPSYLGLFYGTSETGRATLSGRAKNGKHLRLEIERTEASAKAVLLEPTEKADLEQVPEQAPVLEFRAYTNKTLENKSHLIWRFTPPNRGELETREAKPSDLRALLQHPSEGRLAQDERNRYGDAREAGHDRLVIELVSASQWNEGLEMH